MLARRCRSFTQQSLLGRTNVRHLTLLQNKGDDTLLRQIFNAPKTSWAANLPSVFQKRTGLLNNQYLTAPEGFPRFATDSLAKAEFLADYVSRNHAGMSSTAVIRAFDRLSDTLCSVLDLAEFIRNSHPDARYIEAAEQAYGILHGFMNTLNTHTGLFAALQHIAETPTRKESLDQQEEAVLEVLLADFYRSGVHLDSRARSDFIALSTEIANAERKAFTDYAPAQKELLLTTEEAKGLWPNPNLSMMTANGKHVVVPTAGPEAEYAMQTLDSAGSRARLMQAMQTPTLDQLDNMNHLFRARGQLARVVGQESYGASVLARQMAKSPAQVETFLLNLADGIRPEAQAEMGLLERYKQRHLRTSQPEPLHRWDEDYYGAMYVRNNTDHRSSLMDLSPYLSIGTIIQGLSRLFEQLYGTRFSARDMRPGEAWHEDVRCLDVMSDEHGLIGTLYCDLFARPGKSSGLAAHFTVRCGRRLDRDSLLPGEPDIDNGMLTGTIHDAPYQLPVIALQCDFSSTTPSATTSLCFSEVNTLFHEMGHAIHSMLGTTAYQTVSGTRVAADLVELPSQIMESFAASPRIWPLFARHHKTDAPVPGEAMRKAVQSGTHLQYLSRYRQFFRSLLDQRYHATRDQDFDSTVVLRDLTRQYSLTRRDDPVPPWQTQFSHLAGYGATYYSYIFDKAIADRIWQRTFACDPLSRDAGENFKSHLLRYGGSRDPWQCLADVLDEPALAAGDVAAMARVGQWSLEDNGAKQ